MQIVINISKRTYDYILKKHNIVNGDRLEVTDAICDGTPLPKGHRFIDADEILDHAHVEEDEDGGIFAKKWYCIEKRVMDNALVLFDTFEIVKESGGGASE